MLNINIETKEEIEKFLLITNIGIVKSISNKLITIEQAENYLYSPYSVEKIKTLGINDEVIRLIELGCELEDVESLIPNKLNSTLDSMYNKTIELLRKSEINVNNNKKWID